MNSQNMDTAKYGKFREALALIPEEFSLARFEPVLTSEDGSPVRRLVTVHVVNMNTPWRFTKDVELAYTLPLREHSILHKIVDEDGVLRDFNFESHEEVVGGSLGFCPLIVRPSSVIKSEDESSTFTLKIQMKNGPKGEKPIVDFLVDGEVIDKTGGLKGTPYEKFSSIFIMAQQGLLAHSFLDVLKPLISSREAKLASPSGNESTESVSKSDEAFSSVAMIPYRLAKSFIENMTVVLANEDAAKLLPDTLSFNGNSATPEYMARLKAKTQVFIDAMDEFLKTLA